MKIRSRRLAPATMVVACALSASAPAALAAPASVQLRVEGRNTTTFEGPVTSDGHVLRPTSGDDHQCDGTNGGANPTPGPTPTSTLDDGAKLGTFTWDGDYFDGFSDYLVNRVGPDASTSSEFWGQYVNSQSSQVGGCQEIVKSGDEVLWAFDAFSKSHVLKLTGPDSSRTGESVTVRVTDGTNGAPLSGVAVGGAQTGADGRATLTFTEEGVYRLKGSRSDSVRSNGIRLCVDRPGAGPCTSADKTAPRVTALVPDAIATARGRSRTVLFSWQGNDGPDGSGISAYAVDVRQIAHGAVDTSDEPFRPVGGRTALTRKYFRGDSGNAYRFRVTAIDRANNQAQSESGVLSIPVDDRDRKLLKLSGGWRRLSVKRAWGRTVIRSTRKGAAARLAFRGRRVALIGRRLRAGGRVRVTVDGRSKVLSLRGRPKLKSVLFISRKLRSGRHSLRVKTLGGSPVELDAVAPLP